jgi:hypothetical protein
MHISLDSALGRQRRLNSVGESVFQIAPDAAAGYSLRSLTGGDPSVVRVRRESDNGERDFNASGVSSGELVNWVNQQITPPLDLRELTATGRDGPIIEAAAAYSLRNLSDSYTGSVVEVRRSSDGALRSFTAAEVTDGTLVAWVGAGNNGTVSKWYDQSTTSGVPNANHAVQTDAASQPRIVIDGELIMNAKGFPSIAQYRGGAGTNANRLFVINNGLPVLNSTHFAVTQYNRQFSYHLIGTAAAGSSRVGRYSSDQFRISQGGTTALSGAVFPTSVVKLATVNNAASGGTTTGFVDGVQAFSANLADPSSTGLVYKYLFRGDNDSSGALLYSEFIYYSSDQSDNRTALEANIGEVYGIAGIPAYDNTVNGFVETWYDQSGNGNNATQLTAGSQPKIVSAGTLVTNAEGNPALQGATGKSFGLSAITGLDVSIFFVGAVPSSFQAITGWDTNLHMIRFSSSNWEFVANTTDPGNMDWNSALTSGDTALFNFTRSSGTVTGYANSVASDTTSNANSNPFGLNRIFTRSNVNYSDYAGKASELIIYNSDQSANRPAIEANINNQYDIY